MSVQFAGQCPWAVSGKVWQKIRAVVALRAADTLGGSQAVSMALDVRQHGSKTPCRWLWWNGIYTTVCNGKREVRNDYEEAKAYFLEMMMSTDGEGHERAECIYIQLMHGLEECSDEDE